MTPVKEIPAQVMPGGKLVFGFFAALAEFERELIVERTKAGMAAARARGRSGGRPYKMTAAEKKRLDEAPIDYSDIPELDDAFFKNAKLVDWPPPKAQLTIRLDADVLAWLKSNGRGYQTRINRILRVAMESQPNPRPRKKTTSSRS